MQKIIVVICGLLIGFSPVNAQELTGTTGREIKRIADNLIAKLEHSSSNIKDIIISDFTDGKVTPTKLGKFLAEEFGYYLSNAVSNKYNILDRTKLELLLREQGLVREELIDPLSAVKLGKLKGMKHMLYGTIVDTGDHYTIYVKLLDVERQQILVSSRGSITKVPSLPEHL